MKYIISTLIVLFIPLFAFANSVNIFTDKTSYNIDDTISLRIEVESENRWDAQIIVGNLQQNFNIIWQSQSSQTQIINWESASKTFLNLSLLANTAGTYTIWPISIRFSDWENISSQSINIEIIGERILINPNIAPPVQNSPSWSTPQDLSKINLWNKNTDQTKQVEWINGEIMEDIYKIKSNILPKAYTLWSIVAAIIGTGLYVIFIKYVAHHKAVTKKWQKKKTLAYTQLLQKIRHEDIQRSKNIFYWNIGDLFRIYLDNEVQYGLSGKSLSEVQKILPKKLLNIYTKLYYPAYNNQTDTEKDRTNILDTLETIMRKK